MSYRALARFLSPKRELSSHHMLVSLIRGHVQRGHTDVLIFQMRMLHMLEIRGWRKLIDRSRKRIFLLHPSHHHSLSTAALPVLDAYETPLSTKPLRLDKELITELSQREVTTSNNRVVKFTTMSSSVDEAEHSGEMQLPYIHRLLQKFYPDDEDAYPPLVPIMIGSTSPATEAAIGKLLGKSTLFVDSWECRVILRVEGPSGVSNRIAAQTFQTSYCQTCGIALTLRTLQLLTSRMRAMPLSYPRISVTGAAGLGIHTTYLTPQVQLYRPLNCQNRGKRKKSMPLRSTKYIETRILPMALICALRQVVDWIRQYMRVLHMWIVHACVPLRLANTLNFSPCYSRPATRSAVVIRSAHSWQV